MLLRPSTKPLLRRSLINLLRRSLINLLRRSLINLLRELPQTMLVSTHDLPLVRALFPRMVIMDRGEIVADGPTESLLNDVALLEAHGLEKM